MSLEGKIRITLHWDGKRIVYAALQPRSLARIDALLRGKQPDQALQIIPMLFSLCGKAQAAACASALQAALTASIPAIPLWRERLVLAEAVQELLWRFLLDLPRIMHAPADPRLLVRLRQCFAACCIADADERAWQASIAEIEACVSDALFGDASETMRDIADVDALMDCLRRANTSTAKIVLDCWQGEGRWGSSPVALMPCAEPERILAELLPGLTDEADFPSQPHWRGQTMETGALARMQHHPLLAALLPREGTSILARLLARLYEIDALFIRLRATEIGAQAWVQGAAPAAGVGLAWVQNARGLLLHRVALDAQGAISDYRIVAPTEWNFHPAGPCIQGLSGKAAASADEARHCAELLVQSLDPCVSYDIEVEHA